MCFRSENFRVLRKATLIENINISTTQTLLRTIATSVSALLAIIALWAFGGDNLEGFPIALFVGVLAGTHSSISLAHLVLIWPNLDRKRAGLGTSVDLGGRRPL